MARNRLRGMPRAEVMALMDDEVLNALAVKRKQFLAPDNAPLVVIEYVDSAIRRDPLPPVEQAG